MDKIRHVKLENIRIALLDQLEQFNTLEWSQEELDIDVAHTGLQQATRSLRVALTAELDEEANQTND